MMICKPVRLAAVAFTVFVGLAAGPKHHPPANRSRGDVIRDCTARADRLRIQGEPREAFLRHCIATRGTMS